MKPETPLHEYTHLWCNMLRKVNPKEWENVKKLFDKVEGLKEEVKKLYPEQEGDALYEEMITTNSGRERTKKLEDVVRKLAAEEGKSVTESTMAQGFLEKVKEALTKYLKGVADVLGIHFTMAEEVADKVLADWANGVDPKDKIKDERLSEEPPKTNPLAWLAHNAEMFKDEQVQKAKERLVNAKDSGDAEEIKRATADMKQAMETKLRENGIGLVERRKIIGRDFGKIIGEEAGMTEEEMQRYLKKKDEGVMYRVEHAAEVYNKAKGDGRVVPEDVDKKTSEGIEKKFYEEIGDIEKRISESQRKLFEEQVANNFEDFSKMSRNEILNDLYGKELDVWRLERSGEAGDTGDYLSNERIRYECAKAAARRELEYRDVRRRAIEDTYGLRPGTSLTFEDIERTFRKNNRSEEKAQLFEQAVSVVKKLGIDFGVGDDGPNGAAGKAIADREITLFVDGLSKTATRHKMIYQIQSFTKCCIKQQWEPFIL